MTFLDHILIYLGFVLALFGTILFLGLAYRRSIWWFLGCLFVPIVCWIFFFLNIKISLKPFCLQVIGLVILGIGMILAGNR